ncbi:MAG: UvrB/UvrC motif-containing protein [Limnochordia bacterium]
MMCDECRKQPATVMVTRIVNGKKTESYLCQDCARQQNDIGVFSEGGLTLNNILAGLFEPKVAFPNAVSPNPNIRCENCGLSFSDFRRLGQLGCSECYKQFEAELEPIIRRIHGDSQHTGKPPVISRVTALRGELEKSRRALREAIEHEEYEQAAILRDRIKVLEEQLKES